MGQDGANSHHPNTTTVQQCYLTMLISFYKELLIDSYSLAEYLRAQSSGRFSEPL